MHKWTIFGQILIPFLPWFHFCHRLEYRVKTEPYQATLEWHKSLVVLIWRKWPAQFAIHEILVSSLAVPASSTVSRLRAVSDLTCITHRNSGIRATGILQYVASVTRELSLHWFFNDHVERKNRNYLVYYWSSINNCFHHLRLNFHYHWSNARQGCPLFSESVASVTT